MKTILFAYTFTFLLPFSALAQVELEALNQQLTNEKAEWVAGDTSVSELSVEEFKARLGGGLEEIPLEYDLESEPKIQLVPSLDWRQRLGHDWVGGVRDQGQCGSCVAFAAIATMETQYRIDTGRPGLNIRLSPQHLFSCGGGSCFWGWTGDGAARFLKNSGVPDEACFPYQSGVTKTTTSCRKTCRDHQRRSVRLITYAKPTSGRINLNQIKQALQSGPVVAMMNIYDDFRYYRSGIFKHVRGGYMGGHAVSIVGYNDHQRYFVIRNSWGERWGENGFGRISYDDTSGLGSSTWSYRPDIAAALLEMGELTTPQ